VFRNDARGRSYALAVDVQWKAYLRVNDEGAGRKLLFRIQERLDVPMTLGDFVRDDEDPTLFRSTFTTELATDDEASAIYASLLTAGKLAPSWEIGGLPPSGPLWGVASKGIAVSGVTWVAFSATE
jgi:hypothetical protein